jgi:hypothetical protein
MDGRWSGYPLNAPLKTAHLESVENAQTMIDNAGMKNVSTSLRQQGYDYDETARRWVMAVQAGDVFAGAANDR